jgi:hypothetical protein
VGGENGEAQLALVEEGEGGIGQAGLREATGVAAKRDAGEVGEERGHGSSEMGGGGGEGVSHEGGAVVRVDQRGETLEVAVAGEAGGRGKGEIGADSVVSGDNQGGKGLEGAEEGLGGVGSGPRGEVLLVTGVQTGARCGRGGITERAGEGDDESGLSGPGMVADAEPAKRDGVASNNGRVGG